MVLQVAFDADGKLIASHGDYSCNNGAYPAARGLQYRGPYVPVGGLQDAGVWLSDARLVHQHGRACRLSRALGDGIADPRNRAGCGRSAHRYRSDRNPPPQFGHTEGPAHQPRVWAFRARTSRRPNASTSCSRTSTSPPFAKSRKPHGKKVATSDSGLRPMSNRRDPPAASPR